MIDSQPHYVRLFIRVSNARSSEHVHTPREHSFSDDLRRCSVSSTITDPILCRPDRSETTRKGAARPGAQRWQP